MSPVDTSRFMADAVDNLVSLLDTQKAIWEVKQVFDFQATMKSLYPCIEVNATGFTSERIESGGGYLVDVLIDVMYWFQEFRESLAKDLLDRRTSEIGTFIASHPSLNGYAEDVILDGGDITALPDQNTGKPIVVSIIKCRVQKEIFLNYQ